MNGLFGTWNYGNPAAAYLFLLIPLFAFFAWFGWSQRQKSLQAFGSSAVRRISHDEQAASRVRWRAIFLSLAAMWTILTLMDPYQETSIKERADKSNEALAKRIDQEVWLLLDMSASMSVRDENGGETRLEVAKKVAEELLRLLPGRPIRLYTFTSRADLVVPLTWDRLFVQLTLQNLSIDPEHPGGTDLATLFDTINKARKEHLFFANSALVLLTDGGDTTWEIAKGAAQQKRLQTLKERLPQEHATLFAVGVGSQQGGGVPGVIYEGQGIQSKLDVTLLSSLITSPDHLFLSQKYSPYQIAQELKGEIDRTLSYETAEQRHPSMGVKQPRFAIPLVLSILSLLAALIIPGLPTKRQPSTQGPSK